MNSDNFKQLTFPFADESLLLVERVAQAIYHNDGGMTDMDYLMINGFLRRRWGVWTNESEMDPNTLNEWERDDYRRMARAAIDAMKG